jgi:hypothetical protein
MRGSKLANDEGKEYPKNKLLVRPSEQMHSL